MHIKILKFQLKLLKEVTDEEVGAKLENERKNLAELVVKEGMKWRHCALSTLLVQQRRC